MKNVSHCSAQPSHYDKESKHYDAFNEDNSKVINQFIEQILAKYRVKSVLDLSCGTGSQVFCLEKRGFDVVGVDINAAMLKIAKSKARQAKKKINFLEGDMRTTNVGDFDAVLTIFNAIGHLTKKDFEKTLKNVCANLKDGGIYIFDIFNLHYLLESDNITKLTIDVQKKSGNAIAREIQYSTINQSGVLASYDIYHEQIGNQKPKITTAYQTLQVYSSRQLKEMLNKNGFNVLKQCDIDGKRLSEYKTQRILTIARKQ